MAKDIHVTVFVKPKHALNEVQFAAAVDSLANCRLEVKCMRDSTRNYRFDGGGHGVYVNGRSIKEFLGDVQALVAENVQYERCETDLRKANEQFADENCRLNARITEQAGTLEDNARRLANQSISIGNFQAERGAYLQKAESDAEAMKILARQKGDAEEIADDLRAEHARQDNVIESLRAQLAAKDSLLNAAGRDLEVLRERASGFQEELSSQGHAANGMTQRLAAFDEEATRLRTELAEERAARRVEAESAAAAIESAKANFRMADRALSCRNDTIASMEKLLAAKEEERRLDVATLKGVITRQNNELATLRANVKHYACKAVKAKDSLRDSLQRGGHEAVRMELLIHADGSVNIETKAPVVMTTPNVSLTGSINATGALSS